MGQMVQEALGGQGLDPLFSVSAARHASLPPPGPSMPVFVLHVSCAEEQLHYSYDYEDGSLRLEEGEGGGGGLKASIVRALQELFVAGSDEGEEGSSDEERREGEGETCMPRFMSPERSPSRGAGRAEVGELTYQGGERRGGAGGASPGDVLFGEAFLPGPSPSLTLAAPRANLPSVSAPASGGGLSRRVASVSRVTDLLFEALVDEAVYLQPLHRAPPTPPEDTDSTGRTYIHLDEDWGAEEIEQGDSSLFHYNTQGSWLRPPPSPHSVATPTPPRGDCRHSESPLVLSPSVLSSYRGDEEEGEEDGEVEGASFSLDDDFWVPSSPSACSHREHTTTRCHEALLEPHFASQPLAHRFTHPLAPVLLAKDMLLPRPEGRRGLECLGQVDGKYVLAVSATRREGGAVLLAVDQHAAHERVLLEQMTSTLHTHPDSRGARRASDRLPANLPSEILARTELLLSAEMVLTLQDRRKGHLVRSWGFAYQLCAPERRAASQRHCVLLTRVPVVQGEALTAGDFVEFVSLLSGPKASALPVAALEPPAVHRVLASKSCRTAIKFGDTLTKEDCEELLASLSGCDLPFQCAHGRPSISPLIVLDDPEACAQKTSYFRAKLNYRRLLDHTAFTR